MNGSTSVTNADFTFVKKMLQDATGFVLDADKQYLMENRLAPLAFRLGHGSIATLIDTLRKRPSEALAQQLIEAMLNGETTFFRDVFCFDTLRQVVLPGLIERRRAASTLRVWCAACSTGQEPYSLAMLLAEHFPELASWDVQIIATDVSETHLQRARPGRYSQFEVNRGLPAAMLVKYFDQHGSEWVLSDAIRRRVSFAPLNLVEPWPALPSMDLVLLRNVMIYWDVATKRSVLARTRETLRVDGYLVLGAAETTLYVDDAFDRVHIDAPCCFRLVR
jgi:chemotaxis protein methyltransferase CheR